MVVAKYDGWSATVYLHDLFVEFNAILIMMFTNNNHWNQKTRMMRKTTGVQSCHIVPRIPFCFRTDIVGSIDMRQSQSDTDKINLAANIQSQKYTPAQLMERTTATNQFHQ